MQFRIWKNSIADPRLQSVLCSFGGTVVESRYWEPAENTVEVIFGSWKDYDMPHHNLKREIVKKSSNVIVMESPLVGREAVKDVLPDSNFRVGLNGFMRNAQYPEPVTMDRTKRWISEVDLFNPQETNNGDYILVVLQLPGDASLDFIDINQWCIDTVQKVREITNRDIVIRYPQLPREFKDFGEIFKDTHGVFFQHGTHEDKDVTLENAYAVLTYSSGMGVEAILKGRRTYIGSKNGFWSRESSISEVLNKNYMNFADGLSKGEWCDLINSTQWSEREIAFGECREAFEELLEKEVHSE